jgi:protein involved in polysaccharide export with SLBB domain
MLKPLPIVIVMGCVLNATCLLAQSDQTPYNSGNFGNQQLGSGSIGSGSTDCSSTAGEESPGCSSTGNSLSTGQALDFGTGTSQWEYPGMTPSRPGSSSSVYRDDGGFTNGSRSNTQRRTPSYRPRPLTEFQMLVAGSIGRIVPVYGADLFSDVPDTFAPVERIPVTPDYVIGPGDELLIRIWGQVTQNLHLVVDRTGSVYVPQVGEVRVVGLQFGQLETFLRSQLNRVYRNFDLNVNLGQLRSIQIFVTGDASRPGSYTISSLSTLTNAIFACGGPAPQGSLRHIQLRRGEKLVTDFDLYDLLLHGDKSKDALLESGDVIFFAPLGPQIAVVGSVHFPAIYELRSGETVTEGVHLAGGASVAAQTSMEIERSESHSNGNSARIAIDVEMNTQDMALPLVNGDIVRVRARAARFEKTVTLRGNVANPGRFAWHEGMHIRDLIPNKESLLTPDYWLRREQLGLPVADFQPILPPVRQQPQISRQSTQPFNPPIAVPQDVQTAGSGLFPELAVTEPPDNPSTASTGAQYSSLASSTDETSGGPSQSTPSARPAAEEMNSVNGSQSSLGRGPRLITAPHFPIETQVVRTSPDIDWNYAVVERVEASNLTTKLIPFNLGAVVLNHDDSSDIVLEPGDVITVFSDADIRVPRAQQTKYVRLEGEFARAGVYSVQGGEGLRDLVIRAGGLTDQAYLYGSQLSRESTRREQQQRLDEYVSALSYQIEISASNRSTSVVSAQEAATAGASIASQRELVNRLREVRATGRIVLHIDPFQSGVDALPNIPLEDGDRFVVPPTPSTVGIVGAVYDPNSFVYLAHKHVSDYLRNSGGPNRYADRRQIFVIRADGSVVSRQYLQHSLWSEDGFDHQPIYPGDTIVVPEALNKTTLLRGLTDWSSVFSQFALGAAAIQILR